VFPTVCLDCEPIQTSVFVMSTDVTDHSEDSLPKVVTAVDTDDDEMLNSVATDGSSSGNSFSDSDDPSAPPNNDLPEVKDLEVKDRVNVTEKDVSRSGGASSALPKGDKVKDINDDDDITSKAAVALAAVAAAATANNKSPAEAAREARDLAQNFITQATTSSNDSDVAMMHQNSVSSSVTATARDQPVLRTVSLSAVKTHLRQRALETGSTVTDKLCQGDNDTFIQHLLLLEHYRCIDDDAEKEVGLESLNLDDEKAKLQSASHACERLEAILRRIEAAYDSLVDRLPPQSKNINSSENHKDPNDTDDGFEAAVVVPDLLPPCISEKGDVTIEFFRSCLGETHQQSQSTSHRKLCAKEEELSDPSETSVNTKQEVSPAAGTASSLVKDHVKDLIAPLSPGKGGSVFSNMFKRPSAASKSFNVFRKSKRGIHEGKTDASSSSSFDLSTSESTTHQTTLRPGEYVVKIEREMLGLTVENVLERTVVRTVVPNGPAKKAGAKVGSLIVKVGSVETRNLTHFETIDELRQSNRPLQLVMRQISDSSLQSAREEMGRLIKGFGFGTVMDANRFTTDNAHSSEDGESAQPTSRPLIEADLRTDSYTNFIRRRFGEVSTISRSKKDESLAKVCEKLVWILTLLVVGLEREAAHLFSLTDEIGNANGQAVESPLSLRKSKVSSDHHTAKDFVDAAKSISKVLFDFARKKLDTQGSSGSSARPVDGKVGTSQGPAPLVGRNTRGPRRLLLVPGLSSSDDLSVAHDTPLLQIGDVLHRTRSFLADPTSPPAALLRGEVISFLCDILDLDTEMELSEEEAVSSTAGPGAGAGVMNDLGSAGSLLKLIVLNCPIMRSPCCDDATRRNENMIQHSDEQPTHVSSSEFHRLHAGNRFLAVVHRLAASRSTSARISACSLAPVLWAHLDFPYQLQLRGVITRALHDVEVIVRKSTATVLHEIAELVFDSRSVPWLVLMCERAMTDPEPQLRSAAMTLTWHLAEHLPNAFVGDARQGSRYLRRLPNRDDPLFADVYLLQCKLLPVATRLAEDRSPSVRLAVAAQSDRLCDALGDHWSSVIIDVLLSLLSDTDERVRCEAVSCVPRLSEIVLQSTSSIESTSSELSILEALLPASIKLLKDSCVAVRVALATAAGELLTLLVAMARRVAEPSLTPSSDVQPHFERRSDQEVGKKYKMVVDDRLIPTVQLLLNDVDPEVTSAALRAVSNATRSTVQHSRSRHLSVASTDDDVSLASFHSHGSRGEKPVFLPVLSENQVLRLLPTLTELSDSRQWRVRQSAVEIVPALLGCTTMLETRSEISKLCIRLMADHVDAVRKSAAECLCMGGSSLGSHGEDAGGEWISSIVIPIVRKCSIDPLSKQRLLCLKMVEVILLSGVCPSKWYGNSCENIAESPIRELLTIALSLTTDNIANIRLNVGRTLESVIHVFEEEELYKVKEVLAQQLVTENERDGGGDVDVLYFAKRCLLRADFIIGERTL
jgi:PDZ domain